MKPRQSGSVCASGAERDTYHHCVASAVPVEDKAANVARGTSRAVRAQLLEAVERMAGDDYKLPRLAFSLREIARDIGIATPSIYRHFASKEALIAAAVDAGFNELLAEMDRAVKACPDGDALAVLRAQASAYCRFLYRRPGLTRIMFATHPKNWQPQEPFPDHLGQVRYRWITAVEEARRRGWRPPTDLNLAADTTWAAVHGSLMLALISPAGDEDLLLERVAAQFDMYPGQPTKD